MFKYLISFKYYSTVCVKYPQIFRNFYKFINVYSCEINVYSILVQRILVQNIKLGSERRRDGGESGRRTFLGKGGCGRMKPLHWKQYRV